MCLILEKPGRREAGKRGGEDDCRLVFIIIIKDDLLLLHWQAKERRAFQTKCL